MNFKEIFGGQAAPVFLMDGTAFIYRSFFAQRHLKRADGFPTNAITLLTRALLRILREERPRYFLFVMDGKNITLRKDIYAQYKANREAMPEELAMQIEPLRRIIAALGIPVHVTADCEADDCIASLAAKFAPANPVVIVSGDKDLKQCLAPNVVMWDPKDDRLLTEAEFVAEEGAPPSSWADMQALIGDASDNIPGVPGIGPKTARQIFAHIKNLEELRERLDGLPQKIQLKLAPHIEETFTWRELTRLRKDKCADLELADLVPHAIDAVAGRALAAEFEMASIGREIERIANADKGGESGEAAPKAKTAKTGKEIWEWPEAGGFVASAADLPDCAGRAVALLWPHGVKAPCRVAVSAWPCAGNAAASAAGAPDKADEFAWSGEMASLCQWLAAAECIIVPDFKLLLVSSPSWRNLASENGIARRILDLGLCSWLLDPDDGDYAFPRLALRWRESLDAAAGPAALALCMGKALAARLGRENLYRLYAAMELPLAPVLAQMQLTGFAIDPAAFRNFLADVQADLDDIVVSIYSEAGFEFNLRSARQLGDALYGRLGLPAPKMTSGGQPSTSQATLEKFEAEYPIAANILRFRKLDKMRSTYLDPLPRLMDAQGRIHSTFNQTATATGRLSSSDPNLQNIPVRGELGRRMRACFVPARGNLLVAADYSQIELRVLAHLSQDKHLLEAFRAREDIHMRTASLIFDKGEIGADERRMAKTINFGLLYGMGARKLAQDLKISSAQAKSFIDRYFERLSGLRDFYDRIIAGARQKGFVETMAGRKRWLPGINSNNGQARSQAERQAVNTVIQGTAADIVKLAMLAAAHDHELNDLGARMTLQVHDELLLEAPEANAAAAGSRIAAIMREARPGGIELSVPLLVDWGLGKNWAEAH